MVNHLVLITVLCYLASFAGYAVFLATERREAGLAGTIFLWAGVLMHYFALLERSRAEHTVPYDNLYGTVSLFAWLLAVTYIGLEIFDGQRSVGALVVPLVLVVFLAAQGSRAVAPLTLPAGGPLLAFHITLDVLGYAAFALSFVLSLIYLIQNRLLRGRRLRSYVWRFPALNVLERMSRISVVIGLIALVAGMLLGFIWVGRIYGSYSNWNGDPKEIITLVILAVYAAYLWLGRAPAWRGARASALCVFNFLFVVFSLSVVNRYLSGFHRFF
jgi:ABC-type transport system involved in cytochrome c biogenesis permease subunit